MAPVMSIIPAIVPMPKTSRYDRPFRAANRGQHQQRYRGRAGKSVDKPDDQRPHHLIDTEFPKMAIEPTEWGLPGSVRMRFGLMFVRMRMSVIAVRVRMRMR